MKARFSGFPEFTERNKFFSLEAKEQDRKLKEDMEPNLKAYTITKVMVEHATDNRMNVSWTLEATKEAEEGRRRQFSPFPGLPYPLSMPDAWPETRKSPIVLPFCRVFGAVSKFKVPKGWVLGKDLDFVQSNEFGTVSWKVKTTGTGEEEQTVVSFTVEVKQVISNPRPMPPSGHSWSGSKAQLAARSLSSGSHEPHAVDPLAGPPSGLPGTPALPGLFQAARLGAAPR